MIKKRELAELLNSDRSSLRPYTDEQIGLAVTEAAEATGKEKYDPYDKQKLYELYRKSGKNNRDFIKAAFYTITDCDYTTELQMSHGNEEYYLRGWSSRCMKPVNPGFAISTGERVRAYIEACTIDGQARMLYAVLECLTGYSTVKDLLDSHLD